MSSSMPEERGGLRGGVLGRLERLAVFPGSLLHSGKSFPADRHQGTEVRRLITATQREQITLLTASPRGPGAKAVRVPIHVLLFYGNGTCLSEFKEPINVFRDLGATVYAPEYIGYGDSSGQASYQGCLDTAETAYRIVRRNVEGTPGRLVVAGYSLGAAMAISLAARFEVAGLIAISPFTSIRAMADHKFSRWLPVRHLVGDHFDNTRAIAKVRVPTLIAHGSRDRTVPPKMGEDLARTAIKAGNLKVNFQAVNGAGHTDLFDPRYVSFRIALRDFLAMIATSAPAAAKAPTAGGGHSPKPTEGPRDSSGHHGAGHGGPDEGHHGGH